MENASYKNLKPANAYDKAWNYSDEAVGRLCEVISSNHTETSQESRRINILDIGIGTGSLSIKIAERLGRNKVLLHGFDISEHMIKQCNQRAEGLGLIDCVEFATHDATDIINPPAFINKKFDVIIITFVLHYLDGNPDSSTGFDFEWKEVIKYYSERLCDKGLLIQAEVIGDMAAVDGLTPADDNLSNGDFARVWKRYFDHRKDMGKEWNPNIRPASYYNVFKWINAEKSDLNLWQYAGFTCKHKQRVSSTVIEDWINTGQFSSLSVGLEPDQRQSLAKRTKQEFREEDFSITLDCRFVIHQKTGSLNDLIGNSFANFWEYKRKADLSISLPLDGNKLPIKGNKLDINRVGIKEIENSLNHFLEECIIPLSGCTFLDCELTIYDFIRNKSAKTDWASVAIVRPEFLDRRASYTKKISGSKSFVEILYEGRISAGTIVCIKSTSKSAEMMMRGKTGNWIPPKESDKDKENKEVSAGVDFHKRLSSDPGQTIYTYYITTIFTEKIGIGGIILVTETKIPDRFLDLVQIFASDVVNPIGASYLKEEHTRQIGLSARAAVFARNFSHITGSHVISNPEFRNSLGGYHYIYGLRRRLDETYSNFLRAENELFKYITQAPFRAEDLWTQGTKALADARDKLGTGDVFQENTRLFHEYLQGRFDFIARAIDVTQDPPEPVWLVRDLLEGFLRQTAYLDNLVADVGLRLDNMEFYFKIKAQEFRAQWIQPKSAGNNGTNRLTADLPFEIEWGNVTSTDSKGASTNQQQIYELDTMVALPGGMVAAHAFYSLLENIIRNSAKYGALKKYAEDGKYKLTIELVEQEVKGYRSTAVYHHLRIWDNFSSALKIKDNGSRDHDPPDKQTWSELNTRLKKGFVRSNGQPETNDLGMMEMQACSQLLCRQDGDVVHGKPSDIPPKSNLWVMPPESSPTDGRKTYLMYELNVDMPILLGCLANEPIARTSRCLYTSSVKQVCERTPFLMVIDIEWLDKIDDSERGEFERLLSTSREQLPNRILLLCTESNKAKVDQFKFIENSQVIVETDDLLYGSLFGHGYGRSANIDEEQENHVILSAYRAWLLRWKPLPDGSPWDLWIGLDRQASQVSEAWGHADQYMDNESNKLVRLMVKSNDSLFSTESVKQCYGDESVGSKSESQYWEAERSERRLSQKKVLLFDNHGNCFPEAYQFEKADSLQESTRFYQKLSGSVSPDLFRILSRPPQDKFSFCFFIYSLVEACLTNVVVVDERLAWSLVEGYGIDESNPNFAQDLLEHQKAGIFPVFRFRQGETPNAGNAKADKDQSIGFYNLVHKARLGECLGTANSRLRDEGISFAAGATGSSSLGLITPSGSNPGEAGGFEILPDIKKADVILIHEGAMDILKDQMGVKWVGVDNVDMDEHSRQLQALYQLAPIIIRTSGRGRKSKLLGEHLPFIEFGQVSSSLLTARNKFALVRGLLGSVGSKRTDG